MFIAKRLLLIGLLGGHILLYAENLVKNAGFDSDCKVSENYNTNNDIIPYWYTITQNATPDYYRTDVKKTFLNSEIGKIPDNVFGHQNAMSGNAYFGMFIGRKNCEYIQGEIADSLLSNEFYYVSFYVSLAEKSKSYVSNIGIHFTDTLIQGVPYAYAMYLVPEIINPKEIKLNDMQNWQCISRLYKAKGGERYFTIGAYYSDSFYYGYLDPEFVGKPTVCYYYIDGITVEHIEFGKNYKLQNILFESGKSTLLPDSYGQLISLSRFLNQNKEVNIEITGHTDNVGNKDNNKILSEARALEVKKYLVSQKIDKERISTKGFGDQLPVAENETAKGRGLNRRVEFKLY